MTNPNLPLEAAKALSEPIVKLIDSVSNAIGTLYEPTGIRRRAKAEADAAIILAKNHVEIQDIEFRAAKRLRDKEVRRQKNIESITEKAIKALPPSVSSEPVDEDWVYDFFERAQDVSNEQMQEVWARILVGEVAQPSSFSKRTLEVVKTLSANEAKLFADCCRFIWNGEDEEDKLTPVILVSEQRQLYFQTGLTFTTLHMLYAAGLVVMGDYAIHCYGTSYRIEYFGNCYKITIPIADSNGHPYSLPTGNVIFTEAGKELLRIVKAEPDREYERSIFEYWRRGIEIEKANP